MKKIIECVPNFSEGRDQDIISAISNAICQTKGCTLLDVDPGKSTNRTVYTFVGDPESIIEGALAGARVAKMRIDMRNHKGEHPRFGAMDVCPFIPVSGVTMEECSKIAEEFAERAAKELNVPFFLYEESAKKDYRRKLPDIRKGEYEGLKDKLKDPKWKPDFGPSEFVPSWGATATGARMFLIAYNVNILGTSNQAHRIALNLREAGRGKNKPGRLKQVKGIGWFVDEYNMAQVSVNLNNYHVTPIHVLFEEVKKEAKKLNVGVAGSEIVGIVPLEAILMAADYYIEKEELLIYEEDQKIRLAIERMGLNSVAPFKPEEKIIEYIVAEPVNEPLASMSVREFLETIAARTPTPGGGSASALMAAMGTGLGAMAAKLTYGVKKFEHNDKYIRQIIPILHDLTQKLIPLIDADTSAYNEFMQAMKMPKKTEKEKKARNDAMQAGLKTAVKIPLETMRIGDAAWNAMCDAAKYSNPASKSDIQVGAKALETGIWGAFQNVMINIEDIKDNEYKTNVIQEASTIEKRSKEKCMEVISILNNT